MTESPPPGYVEPYVIYVVELTDPTGEECYGQTGAFPSEIEARKLLARMEQEGRPARLNIITVHQRWEDYEFNR